MVLHALARRACCACSRGVLSPGAQDREGPPARGVSGPISRRSPGAGFSSMAPLELRGRQVPDGRVNSALVVEGLDVIEGLLLRLGVALESLSELGLECREPALHCRVVVAVPAS